ncbi:toprim domain-containing protein [Marinobacter salinisoli]|uniref:Toprim domain-containing protein n=1 Tax=Marinobacter salinisoli TaxID=2769486 RepID=A0ABX7MXZ5_9GAMM|nr:toprim domain-containing protein [Marinobacter salinisoli]QSP95073.1 toprim domain-containing protein [Marinobacter salinisoli]
MKKAPATEAAKRLTRHKYNSTQPETRTVRSCADCLASIHATLLQADITPVDVDALMARIQITDGEVIRFATAGKPRHKNGWLIAYHDRGLPHVVIAGDWSSGAETKWIAGTTSSLTAAEKQRLQHRIHEARETRKAKQIRQWERVAAKAARLWHASSPAAPNHPYLRRKGIQAHGARQIGRNIVLLITDFYGKAWSLQTINEAGEKRLLAGGRKSGNFVVVAGPACPARILICEGYATGCTLAELHPEALVLAALDCGNLKTVATGARNRWPSVELIICGDDDRKTPGNPGAKGAHAAAVAASAKLALPTWPPAAPLHLSDFNDLINWQGGAA